MKKILLYIMLAAVSGCYYDVEEELYPSNTIAGCDTVTPVYATRIETLFSTSCAISGCHVGGSQSPDLSTYNNIIANLARVKTRAVIEKSMPPSGPLPACDIVALQKWIDAGAPAN